MLRWSIGGYFDVCGVQSNGDTTWINRCDAHNSASNNKPGSHYEGMGVIVIASNLTGYSHVRIIA